MTCLENPSPTTGDWTQCSVPRYPEPKVLHEIFAISFFTDKLLKGGVRLVKGM